MKKVGYKNTTTDGDFSVAGYQHSSHSKKRADQRGIDKEKLGIAIKYGQCFYKQGLIYCVLGEQDIPQSIRKENGALKNLVVVIASDSGTLITCYRCNNPYKHIKLKSKRLSIN